MGQRSRATIDQKWEKYCLQDRQFRTSCRSRLIYRFWKQFVFYNATTGIVETRCTTSLWKQGCIKFVFTGNSKRNPSALWFRTRHMDRWRQSRLLEATGWISVVIIICWNLVGLVSILWTTGRVAETGRKGTQTLEKSGCARDIPTRGMIAKLGKPALCIGDCFFLFFFLKKKKNT